MNWGYRLNIAGFGKSMRKKLLLLVRKVLLCVVRRHLTPPPSSTNMERLFSYGGLVATDHRSSLSGEKLNQILFLPSWQILTLDGCRMMLCNYHFKMMIKKVNIMYSWFQEILILWIHSLKWNSGIYLKKEWNSGPSISRFMMDTLCFFHVVLAFLLTLTVDRFWTSTESENVFSDVSNLLQWLSDNPNSTPGSLHKMVKWSPNHYWPTFALKAYRWIRKIRHFLPRHKYSLNP